jgi:hypothetical protein
MENMKEDRDGSHDPENHSDSNQRVGPQGESFMAFLRRE